MPIIDLNQLVVSPAVRKLITEELTIGLCQPQLEPGELDQFIDYLLLAISGLAKFYLTDEAIELEPENNTELRQLMEDLV